MFDEPFAQGDSFIHKFDPRARLILALAGTACLAALQGIATAGAAFLLSLLLLILSAPPWGLVARRLLLVNIFILFMWLTVPLTMPGEALWQLGALAVSRRGLALMGLITVKGNAIVMLLMAFIASMNFAVLGAALQRLRCPEKLAFLFLFAYRYAHVAAGEWRTLHNAARLRGFVPRTDLHSYKTFGYLLGMTFVRGFDRSRRVYEAMLLRGFAGRVQSLASFRASARDWAFSGALLACWVGIAAVDFYYRGAGHA